MPRSLVTLIPSHQRLDDVSKWARVCGGLQVLGVPVLPFSHFAVATSHRKLFILCHPLALRTCYTRKLHQL